MSLIDYKFSQPQGRQSFSWCADIFSCLIKTCCTLCFSLSQVCTLFFMVLYFFTMAGSVWWVILTITWFLAAVPKWGSEAIEKKALLFHAIAWGLPGALTVTLLALNKIEGDGISGVCFIGLYDIDALRWFVLAPLCLNVAVSTVGRWMSGWVDERVDESMDGWLGRWNNRPVDCWLVLWRYG